MKESECKSVYDFSEAASGCDCGKRMENVCAFGMVVILSETWSVQVTMT